MIPGNADPRRPDKVQRYKASAAGNGTAPGEDLTPDYMNILGPDPTSGNADGDSKTTTVEPVNVNGPIQQQQQPPIPQQQQQQKIQQIHRKEDVSKNTTATTTNTINVIPTSPQYGVAIIPTTFTTATIPNDTSTTTLASMNNINSNNTNAVEGDIKDMNATPNKNDRFKVVKIASAEPFRRGRWKCMDYVDQAPPTSNQSKTSQASTAASMTGNVYMQTQSLPPQQIQQLLLQSGFNTTSVPQYFQGTQVIPPQAQYFYQANVQPQTMPMMIPQPQFVTGGQQPQQYFQPTTVITTGSVPAGFQGMQFVQQPQQNNSAFVPTSQGVQIPQSFVSQAGSNNNTPGQTFADTTNQSQQQQQQPMVNGYAYSQPQNEQQHPQIIPPNQVAKNIILSHVQNVDVQVNSDISQNTAFSGAGATTIVPQTQGVVIQTMPAYDPNAPTNMYTNPQFVASVNSLPPFEQSSDDQKDAIATTEGGDGGTTSTTDDPAKTNPVVNAIDNKIEQAMDLVKSHLMYTVREEVEVLKEKIAELMERIQQLETENNFLRSQIPKNQQQQQQQQQGSSQNGGTEPPPPSSSSTNPPTQ